ncbi:hypothetical protein ABVT39_003529 [Epinephelus coioides]
MDNSEETDFFWEPWTWTPRKGKRKKKSKKDKKNANCKNNIAMKMDENIQKKKKSSKFKEAMKENREAKKEKKKKKNRLHSELDDSFIFPQGSSVQTKPTMEPGTLIPHSSDKLKPGKDCKKKTKRKKKVAFDLPPAYIYAKHSQLSSSSQHSPKESVFLVNEAVRDAESCSQVTATGHSQGQTHANESQCTNEDINSQDLFITQKTFRVSPSEPSSGEASDQAITTSPQMFAPRNRLDTPVVWLKQHLDQSYKCPHDLHFHQDHGETNEQVQQPKTVQVLLTEEEEQLKKAHQSPKEAKSFFETQMELNTNLNQVKKVAHPAHKTPSVENEYLDEPIVVKPSLGDVKSKQSLSYLSDEPAVLPPMSLTSTSTQTENFFTTELSSYLNFYQKRRLSVHFENLKPLDLSMPERARKNLGTCLSVTLQEEIKSDNHKEPSLHPSCSSDTKDGEAKKEPSGRQPCSGSTQGKCETTLSPQSESEAKSADTTASSEDDPPCRTGKLDLIQVRAVQMRLNESFFFKTKGEGRSPRPESPLMKLAQGREVKSRKGH